MRVPLVLLGLSTALAALGFLYFLSQNPFEFVRPGCDSGAVEDWFDVLGSGCVDPGYAARFILIYGAMIFVLLSAIWGLTRLIGR